MDFPIEDESALGTLEAGFRRIIGFDTPFSGTVLAGDGVVFDVYHFSVSSHVNLVNKSVPKRCG